MSTSPTLPSSHPTSPILPNLTLAGSALARVLGGADMPCAGLAPMAGITDMPTRLLASECGAAFCVTEMISAKGYVCAPENREAIRELVQRHPDEGPLAAQLFGHEPGYMAEAVRRIQDEGFSWIDINMGCPAPKIAGNGDGSALMDDPVLAGRMVAAAVKASRGPVTVKIRSGRDENHINCAEIARICQEEGAAAVTVHARTRRQQYSGHSDWNMIRLVKESLSIPVIGNGDVASGQDALKMVEETGCDMVMCARAARGNPWLFAQIRAAFMGLPYTPPDAAARMEAMLRHARMLCGLRGEKRGMRQMRKQAIWYVQGLRGASQARIRLQDLDTLSQLTDIAGEIAGTKNE